MPELSFSNLSGSQINLIIKKLGGEESALSFLRDEFTLIPTNYIDNMVRVEDRNSIFNQHKILSGEILHPDLEKMGPSKYNLMEDLIIWPNKSCEFVNHGSVYEYLKSKCILKDTLGIHDGQEIRKKGHHKFHSIFGARSRVPLWKSARIYRSAEVIHVPTMRLHGISVIIDWVQLEKPIESDNMNIIFRG